MSTFVYTRYYMYSFLCPTSTDHPSIICSCICLYGSAVITSTSHKPLPHIRKRHTKLFTVYNNQDEILPSASVGCVISVTRWNVPLSVTSMVMLYLVKGCKLDIVTLFPVAFISSSSLRRWSPEGMPLSLPSCTGLYKCDGCHLDNLQRTCSSSQ